MTLAERKARKSQFMVAVESGTIRQQLKDMNLQFGQLSHQLTSRMTDMIAEFISLPQFVPM